MVLCRSGSFGLVNARDPFGLSLSKPGRAGLKSALVLRAEAGLSPRRATHFSLLRQRKVSKRKATPSLRPLRVAKGQTCGGAVAGCAVELALRLRRAARTTTASQFTKHGRFDAHAHPATAPSQAQPAGEGQPNIQTSTRAFASLGRVCAARGVCAREMGPSAAQRSNGPCGCPLPGFPSVRAEKRRAGGACVCRRTHALRALTHRSCPSGAPQARSEFCGGTLCPSITGCP